MMTISRKRRGLSETQIAFAELLKDNTTITAKDAALQVGCSVKSARVLGPRWKKLPEIQAIIAGVKGNSKATPKARKATTTKATLATLKATAGYGGQPGKPTQPAPVFEEHAEPLNDRQIRFCIEYLMDGNGTRAYQRVYPHSSYDAARVSAHDLLTNPNIMARIEELQDARLSRLRLSADQVLELLTLQATYDPRDLFDADWRLKPFDELSPDAARIIGGFTTKATTTGEDSDGIVVTTNVKLPDRLRAAELLGRYHKLFVDRIEIGADEEFARRLGDGVNAARREAKRGKK